MLAELNALFLILPEAAQRAIVRDRLRRLSEIPDPAICRVSELLPAPMRPPFVAFMQAVKDDSAHA